MKIIQLDQRSQEWHDWRNGKDLDGFPRITATTAAVVSGRSKWKTPWRLWNEMTGRRQPDPVNPAMLRGVRLEPVALAAYEELVGFRAAPVCIEHDNIPWAAASLDGLNVEKHVVVEIKCPGEAHHAMALAGVVPPLYWAQMQWQLLCAGNGFIAHYWSFDGAQGKLLVVPPDPVFQQTLLAQAEEFRRMLVEDVPPAGDDWMEAARQWRAAKQAVEDAKALLEEAESKLKELAGEQERIEAGGVIFSRYSAKGSVDNEALLRDLGVDEETVERYRKPGSSRIRITQTKEDMTEFDRGITVTQEAAIAVAAANAEADAWW